MRILEIVNALRDAMEFVLRRRQVLDEEMVMHFAVRLSGMRHDLEVQYDNKKDLPWIEREYASAGIMELANITLQMVERIGVQGVFHSGREPVLGLIFSAITLADLSQRIALGHPVKSVQQQVLAAMGNPHWRRIRMRVRDEFPEGDSPVRVSAGLYLVVDNTAG